MRKGMYINSRCASRRLQFNKPVKLFNKIPVAKKRDKLLMHTPQINLESIAAE